MRPETTAQPTPQPADEQSPHTNTQATGIPAHKPSVHDYLKPAERATRCQSMRGLRDCLDMAIHRVEDARAMGWPALEASWQRDVDMISALISARESEGA